MSVRVRFAPSPTGHVHIGNIRVAIFNWLFARHEGGKFLLRIEDTDRERSTPEAVQAVLDALEWLGLDYDEEPLYQSTRHQAHLDAAQRLLDAGLAYKEDKGGTGNGECVIFRMPGRDMSFYDEVKGTLTKKAEDLQDLVIVRSNGTPVFHLANVVDDIDMGITHVIRGDDHIENTYRHVALYEALGAVVPKFAHLPMIVNNNGKPYSKRDGSAFVGEFKELGYYADSLVNFLALLGWSPGEDREKMSRQEMIDLFTLDRVKSGPGQMDMRKLTHLNGQYIAELPAEEFAAGALSVALKQEWGSNLDMNLFAGVCGLLQTRTSLFPQVADWKYFFTEIPDYNEKAVRKNLKKAGRKEFLEGLLAELNEADFTEESIEAAIRKAEAAAGQSEGKMNQPTRVAVTGNAIGAGIYETMNLLGKEKCLARIRYAIDLFLSDGEG